MVWILVLVAPLLLPPFQKGVLCPQSATLAPSPMPTTSKITRRLVKAL